MRMKKSSSGVALLLVLWTLAILSAIALTLAAAVGTEVRASQDFWNDLQAERLARSGQEIASYLETRSLGSTSEDLSDLPVQPLILGLRYRVIFDVGSVDLLLEGENGRLDVSATTEEDLAAFFSAWNGDLDKSREAAASIADWVDRDDDARAFGGESLAYSGRGYLPRNSSVAAADLFLIKGLRPEDFTPAITQSNNVPAIRESLPRFISRVPTGAAVNPNYAPVLVLTSVPGMTRDVLARILEGRQRSVFTTVQDFRERVGLAPDNPILTRFTFNRGSAPAISALARVTGFQGTKMERRTRTQTIDRRRGIPVRFVSFIERSASAIE